LVVDLDPPIFEEHTQSRRLGKRIINGLANGGFRQEAGPGFPSDQDCFDAINNRATLGRAGYYLSNLSKSDRFEDGFIALASQ